jgi:CMP-2-keto-3-deoxyoctulosonic acid synthetase
MVNLQGSESFIPLDLWKQMIPMAQSSPSDLCKTIYRLILAEKLFNSHPVKIAVGVQVRAIARAISILGDMGTYGDPNRVLRRYSSLEKDLPERAE